MNIVYYICLYIYFNNIIFYVWSGKPVKTLYLYIIYFFATPTNLLDYAINLILIFQFQRFWSIFRIDSFAI